MGIFLCWTHTTARVHLREVILFGRRISLGGWLPLLQREPPRPPEAHSDHGTYQQHVAFNDTDVLLCAVWFQVIHYTITNLIYRKNIIYNKVVNKQKYLTKIKIY